jgi:hypothetical protein
MKDFPVLKTNEVAILFCEHNTGHVLDINLKLQTNEVQEIYLISKDLETAIETSKKILRENNHIECNLYNYEHELIKTLH